MPDTSVLRQYYDYWDGYVLRWLTCESTCCPFLPEPWWGWSPLRGKSLHSVVINLNPGKGGALQTRDSIRPILGNLTYREAMSSGALPGHLRETDAWHTSHRAKPILAGLPDVALCDNDYLSHHLSIELSPLHSATSREVDGYVAANTDEVVAHSLRFAADASRLVEGPLHGVVIVRCAAKRFLHMFGRYGIEPCGADENIAESPCWLRFNYPGFEDVVFVCVWGARNNIPQKSIKSIIQHINKQINKQKSE